MVIEDSEKIFSRTDLLFIIGETPLLVAVKKNNEMMIKFLLDLGAHPDITDFKVFFFFRIAI